MKKTALLLLFFVFIYPSLSLGAEEKINILITSGIKGKFDLNIDDQDEEDPILRLAQAIIEERKKKHADIYIDLGNAFYPGALSKYSFGSAMMDFFEYMKCDATLISSLDIKIGIENLEFLQKDRKTLLLSSNIQKNNRTVFSSFMTYPLKNGKSLIFIGISSQKTLFDISEKKLRKISLKDTEQTLTEIINHLQIKEQPNLILLSGLTHEENIAVLKKFPQIQLIISGGDNPGTIQDFPAQQVTFADGRTIYYLPEHQGYYLAELALSTGPKISNWQFKKPETLLHTEDLQYLEYRKRLSIWKTQFIEDKSSILANLNQIFYPIDNLRLSYLMRDFFGVQIAIIKKDSVSQRFLQGSIREFDLYRLFNSEYPFLMFNLKGSQLKTLVQNLPDFIVSGYESDDTIHGYPINDSAVYGIISTQSGYETAKQILQKEISYKNTWKTFSDLIVFDLKGEQKNLTKPETFLNSRFFSNLNVSFTLYYESSSISKGNSLSTPAGQPEASYKQIGFQSEMEWNIYNRWHQFIITPTINFEQKEQDGQPPQYNNNLLRGTFVYKMNLDFILKPYHKSQIDTVVRETEGSRPALIRETIGTYIGSDLIEGKLGFGFERKIQEPVLPPQYGIEFLLKLKWPITDQLSFQSSIDFFWSQEEEKKSFSSLKNQIQNGLYFNFSEDFSISLRYNWFYYYSGEYGQSYSYSQIFTGIDLKTNFKIF